MCKLFCSLFSNHEKDEEFIDEDRNAMRMHFGIKDKYLIEYFFNMLVGIIKTIIGMFYKLTC